MKFKRKMMIVLLIIIVLLLSAYTVYVPFINNDSQQTNTLLSTRTPRNTPTRAPTETPLWWTPEPTYLICLPFPCQP